MGRAPDKFTRDRSSGMILSNTAIHDALDCGRLVIVPTPDPRDPMAPNCPYQTSAVDLRLSDEISVYQQGKAPLQVDLRSGGFAKLGASVMEPVKLTEDQPFVLGPNRFVLGRTLERVGFPLSAEADKSLAARVEGKSSYARCGMLVHFTAPTIHAGFEGTIALEIMNLGRYSISLHPGMPICQLIIEEVRGIPIRNDSQFQGQSKAIGALVRESKTGKTVAAGTRIHIRTAYEAGIPSSAMRLRMLQASRASTACASASRACSRSPRIVL